MRERNYPITPSWPGRFGAEGHRGRTCRKKQRKVRKTKVKMSTPMRECIHCLMVVCRIWKYFHESKVKNVFGKNLDKSSDIRERPHTAESCCEGSGCTSTNTKYKNKILRKSEIEAMTPIKTRTQAYGIQCNRM